MRKARCSVISKSSFLGGLLSYKKVLIGAPGGISEQLMPRPLTDLVGICHACDTCGYRISLKLFGSLSSLVTLKFVSEIGKQADKCG